MWFAWWNVRILPMFLTFVGLPDRRCPQMGIQIFVHCWLKNCLKFGGHLHLNFITAKLLGKRIISSILASCTVQKRPTLVLGNGSGRLIQTPNPAPGAFLEWFDSGLVTQALFSAGLVVGVENHIPWSHCVELTQIDFDDLLSRLFRCAFLSFSCQLVNKSPKNFANNLRLGGDHLWTSSMDSYREEAGSNILWSR